MKAETILERDDFKKCVEFHGHLCPGLSIGYRASRAGLERLNAKRSEDEEIVAIVETDACCADAVQVVTGCTFGKGNFIYKDHGKNVFTFLNRATGNGVRIALKDGAIQFPEEHRELMEKVMRGDTSDEEEEKFEQMHLRRSHDVLEIPLEALFSITETKIRMPDRARIEPSKPCSRCGEPTMASKLRMVDGRMLCGECGGAAIGS